jgi:hypothetical protein
MKDVFVEKPLRFGWTLCQYWPAEIILKHPSRKRGIYIKAPWYRWADRKRHEAKDGSFPLEKDLPQKEIAGTKHFFLHEWDGAKLYRRRFVYTTRYGEMQVAEITAKRSRVRSVLYGLRWLPFAGHDIDTLTIEFSEEMGSERGSWKGGAIGTSVEMWPGESVEQTVTRFLTDAQVRHRWDR